MASVAVQESAATLDLSCDDYYFSLMFDDESVSDHDSPPISDDKYAEELQFQETILSSLIANPNAVTSEPPLVIIEVERMSMGSMEVVEVEGEGEKGESSQMFCEICAERKESEEMFRLESCSHVFCTACISKHVATKVQDSIHVVTCPGLNCKGSLEFDSCKAIVPSDVLTRWDEVLCESLIPASEKFYCPYRDCSAMMVNDGDGMITASECPLCHRLFCALCNVPWHSGVGCEEFQKLNEDERGREDIMVWLRILLCVWGEMDFNSWWLPVIAGLAFSIHYSKGYSSYDNPLILATMNSVSVCSQLSRV
nr:probable E3 ubiquitin-protein ligase RNF217 [Ipomoea batatas]